MVIAPSEYAAHSTKHERMLVVADRLGARHVADDLKRQLPDWAQAQSGTFLSAIADLCTHPARLVVACVSPSDRNLTQAVSGLRMAAGHEARVVLCCQPAAEPQVRGALKFGADDYLLYPLSSSEVERVIGSACPLQPAGGPAPPAIRSNELSLLRQALQSMDGPPQQLLELAAQLIQCAMSARGVTLVAQGTARTAGEPVVRPVLSAPLHVHHKTLGQISLGDCTAGAYTTDDAARLAEYAAVIAQILHAAAEQRRLEQLAMTDECSGLPNRRYLNHQLDLILSRAATERFPVTLLLFDIDDFKSYNDRFGHDAGDEILRVTGGLFRRHSREQDVVTRYGGDEFAVIFWDPEGARVAGSAQPACALDVLDRFQQALRAEHLPQLGTQGTGRVTISGGLATYPWDGTTRAALMNRADEALRAAKRAGKNRVFVVGNEPG